MIYFILNSEANSVKIGYTQQNPKERLANLQTGCSCYLVLIATVEGDMSVEKQYHEQFAKYRQNGEWFFFGEEIKDFITNLHNDNVNEESVNLVSEKKLTLPEKLFEICKKYNYNNTLKKDRSCKTFYTVVDNIPRRFNIDSFKYDLAENYQLFPTNKQLHNVLNIVVNDFLEIQHPADDNVEMAIVNYVQKKIDNNTPFRLKDVVSELKLKTPRTVVNDVLINVCNLKKPTKTQRVESIKGYWWNVA